MEDIHLFDGISSEEQQAMIACFKPERKIFRRGETILVYSSELEHLCVLSSGKAHLYCMDSEGEYTLLEQYWPNDIFGEIFAMPYGDLGYAVEADSDCEVLFFPFNCVYGRCPKACPHHSLLVKNLFQLSAKKAQSLAMRISLISKRSLRRKLLCYFQQLSESCGSTSFRLDISLSQLASYLCADRTSMTRELKNMCDEGMIKRSGRDIQLL